MSEIDGGTIKIGVDVDLSQMDEGFDQAKKMTDQAQKDIEKSTNGIDKSFDKLIKTGEKMKKVGANLTKFVTLPIAGIAAASINLAMEAVESENLFEESFGGMADTARKWSDDLSESLGLNAYELRRNSGMFYVMADAMGLTEEASFDMSTNLTELAADMASFYNIDIDTAIEKLRGGITGEAEGLKQFGIIVNETTTEAYALRTGIIKQGEAMTEQQKVTARYGLIMEATEKAQGDLARTMDSPSNKIRIQKERIKELGIELGTKLMPLFERGLDLVEDAVDWLSQLDEQQIEQIIKWGMIAAAAGPVLGIMGNMVTVFGGVGKAAVPLIAKLVGTGSITAATTAVGSAAGAAGGTVGLGALATGLGGAVVAAAPFIVAGAAVVGAGYLISEALNEEVVPAVDLFADQVTYTADEVSGQTASLAGNVQSSVVKISDATQNAVQAYIDMDDQATAQLQEMYTSGTTITGDIVTDMTTKFGTMKDTIVNGFKEQKEESVNELNELFTLSSSMTAEEQAKVLSETNEHYDQQGRVAQEYQDQIMAIYQRAADGNRAITAEEAQEIGRLQFGMKDTAVKALSETEIEATAIRDRLAANQKNITAKSASEYITKLNQVKTEAIAAANGEYDGRIASIIRMRDELGTISNEQAALLIDAAERTKNESIMKAEQTRLGSIDKFRQLYGELDDTVDTGTGEILTEFDKMKRWWNNWQPETKNFNATITTSNIGPGSGRSAAKKGMHANASGTQDFEGGYTTLHERGYEVYDLPQGTRIFPHEASMDIVEETVNKLANQYIAGNEPRSNQNLLQSIGQMLQGAMANGVGSDKPIELVVNLDGKTIARVSEPHISTLQGKKNTFNQLAYGRG